MGICIHVHLQAASKGVAYTERYTSSRHFPLYPTGMDALQNIRALPLEPAWGRIRWNCSVHIFGTYSVFQPSVARSTPWEHLMPLLTHINVD